jgi:hypothetical protein
MMSEPSKPNYRKLTVQLVFGGLVGAALSLGTAVVFEQQASAANGIWGFVLFIVGAMIAVMGVFVGFGLVFPALGAKLLNVADRDDLADQRAILTGSAISCMALGAALMLVALSGPEGPVPGSVAIVALACSMVLMVVITIAQWRYYDEMMRNVSLEASAWMAALLFPAIMLWATAVHIGQVAAIDPLALIGLLAVTMLLATFIATGRRGLLMPS